MFTLKCFDKELHNGYYLEEIYHSGENGYGEAVSIKWCPECGAVVGDIEVDGRLMDRNFKMRYPKTVKLRKFK